MVGLPLCMVSCFYTLYVVIAGAEEYYWITSL